MPLNANENATKIAIAAQIFETHSIMPKSPDPEDRKMKARARHTKKGKLNMLNISRIMVEALNFENVRKAKLNAFVQLPLPCSFRAKANSKPPIGSVPA
jgi:hypothetical protein